MYMLLNPSQRRELATEIRSQEEVVLLPLEMQFYESQKKTYLWKSVVIIFVMVWFVSEMIRVTLYGYAATSLALSTGFSFTLSSAPTSLASSKSDATSSFVGGGRGGGRGGTTTSDGHLTAEQDEEIFREYMEKEERKEEEYVKRCREEEEEWEARMDWTHPMH
nr:hypothetical protein [Tanacetum cinerariifolium]